MELPAHQYVSPSLMLSGLCHLRCLRRISVCLLPKVGSDHAMQGLADKILKLLLFSFTSSPHLSHSFHCISFLFFFFFHLSEEDLVIS